MAYSTLPIIPLVIFGVLEPAMLIWAYVICLNDPFQYYADQTLVPLDEQSNFPTQARSVTLQLGNVLLLLAAMAVVCCFSPSRTTAKWYLIAVAFADYGHIYASYQSLGPGTFYDPSQWNHMIAGNIGASAVLNVLRWLTVLGAFGRLRGSVEDLAKKRA